MSGMRWGRAPLYRDAAYREALVYWQDHMAEHEWICRRCGRRIPAGDRTAWDLGHPDQPGGRLEPEHKGCNRAAGGRSATHYRKPTTSREW